MILLPASANEPIRFFLAPPGATGVARMANVSVDTAAAHLLAVQDPSRLSAAENGLRWAHDLHFGQGLGLTWRILTVLAGLALPLFAVTGTAMWVITRRRKRIATTRRAALSAGE